jgi:hypothetical protein
MKLGHLFKTFMRGGQTATLGAALLAGVALTAPQPAQALTIMLNFVNASSTDRNGVTTTPESFASWGFTSLDVNGVRNAVLASVMADYLSYPTSDVNPLSPLPAGRELNIHFEVSLGQTTPLNGDPEYFYMNIGDANPNVSFLGQACLGCVRNASGVATVPIGSIFGSTVTDTIASLLSLATTDEHRINLLAGTAAHEIGHALGLVHPSGQLPNPGQSLWSIMATGASPSLMPSNQRILDRAFAYTEFQTLVTRIGTRDVAPIPEPGTYLMLAVGLLALTWRVRAARHLH